jgi:hypothetical protein
MFCRISPSPVHLTSGRRSAGGHPCEPSSSERLTLGFGIDLPLKLPTTTVNLFLLCCLTLGS